MAATEQSTRANAALDDLYRRHVADVYRYTYAVLGNHADAEDVTQTTFVNALRALERGEQPRNASSWLLAIAHNLVRQRWRQAAARPTEIELVGDVAAETREDEVELDDLVKALQRIPPAQREALVMRELEGRSYQEISELLGVTTSALETLLFRARRSLAEELENLVTCQTAELAMSQRLDGRLSRKERRRLKEHLGECASCARLAEMHGKQRRAFKGLALLPLPIGLTLFKGVPSATAAVGLSSIGGAATAATGGSSVGVGAASATTVGATGVGVTGATTASAAAGGSLVGGAVAKVAAVVVAASVATGVGYQGLEVIRADAPGPRQGQLERVRATPSKSPAQRAASRSSSSASSSPAPGLPARQGGSTGRVEPTQRLASDDRAGAAAPGPARTSVEPRTNRGGGVDRTAGGRPDSRKTAPDTIAPTTPAVDTVPPSTGETAPQVDEPGVGAQGSEAGGLTSTKTTKTTGTTSAPSTSGTPDETRSGCPAGGSGPGSGSGCGVGLVERTVRENAGGRPDSGDPTHGQPVKEQNSDADPGKPAKP